MRIRDNDETDWAFIGRIASRLGAQVIPSAWAQTPSIQIGFPSQGKVEPIESPFYRFGLDDALLQGRSGSKSRYTYCEVEDSVPRQLEDWVRFPGAIPASLRSRLY